MTGSVSVSGGDVALGVMPFNQKGNRPRKKSRSPNKSNWKELTVWVNPWKKTAKSQYQMANSYLGCESFQFGETACRIEEAVAICAATIVAEQQIPEEDVAAVYQGVEEIFEWWRSTSLRMLAERAVSKLNEAVEYAVLQAHAMTEGAEAELDGPLAPAFKLEDSLMFNPSYQQVLEAMTESLDPLANLDRIYSCTEAEAVPTESLESAIHKIAAAFKLTP